MRTSALLLLALPAGLCAPAIAQAQSVSDAVRLAYRSNPTLEEARLAVEAAREDVAQARADYLPQVDVVLEQGARDVVEDRPVAPTHTDQELEPASSSVRGSQRIYAGGRRSAQGRQARATLAGAQQNLHVVEQQIVLSAIKAYADLLRDHQIAAIQQANVVSLADAMRVTQRRLDVGDVSRTDLSQAQARHARAQAGEAAALADLQRSRAAYEAVTGEAPGPLAPLPAAPALPETLEQALANAEHGHPTLMQGEQEVESARARIGIERAALRPEVSVIARADQAEDQNFVGDEIESASVSARLAMRLYDGGMARSRVRQSRIGVNQAEQRLEAQRREVLANVVSAWHDATAAQRIVEAARVQLAADDAAWSGVRREQGLGLRSTLDVLNAQQELLDSGLALARAERDAFVGAFEVLAAVGALEPAAADAAPAVTQPAP